MGQIRSTVDLSGLVIDGILLGSPAVEDGIFVWDDNRIPSFEVTGEVQA